MYRMDDEDFVSASPIKNRRGCTAIRQRRRHGRTAKRKRGIPDFSATQLFSFVSSCFSLSTRLARGNSQKFQLAASASFPFSSLGPLSASPAASSSCVAVASHSATLLFYCCDRNLEFFFPVL